MAKHHRMRPSPCADIAIGAICVVLGISTYLILSSVFNQGDGTGFRFAVSAPDKGNVSEYESTVPGHRRTDTNELNQTAGVQEEQLVDVASVSVCLEQAGISQQDCKFTVDAELVEVAQQLLGHYQDQSCLLIHASWLDLFGKTWACVVASSTGADLCVLTTKGTGTTHLSLTHFVADDWEELVGATQTTIP